MRRRLVVWAVGVVVVALLLFAVPLGVVLRAQIITAELDAVAARIEQIATFVDEQSRTCGEVQLNLEGAAGAGIELTIFDRAGVPRFAPGVERAGEIVAVPEVLATAINGATGSAVVGGSPVVAVPLSTLRCGERLVLQARTDGTELQRRVQRSLLLVALGGLGAIVLGGIGASTLASHFARPLERLARSARRLGEGDFSERAPRTGLPEPDGIADALDATADRLGRAVARGTAFAADASHQLRTPLTALRLQLEAAEVGLEPDDDRRVALDGALAEVDRLASTIDELVALTQLDAGPESVDLVALVTDRAEDWRRRAAELDREVVLTTGPVPPAQLRPAAVVQAVDVLVDNALRHGHGRVEVRLESPAPDAADAPVRVTVVDEGPGLPDGLDVASDRGDRGAVPVHGGRGLVLARDLVEGEGGRLVLRSTPDGTAASLLLPTVRPRGVDTDGPAR